MAEVTGKIKIRQMVKADIPLLADIYTRAYAIYRKWERWNKKAAHDLLEYWINRQPDLAFVVEYDGKIVGAFVAGIKPWWDGNHLVDGEIFVDPNYQKKGFGTSLLKFALERAVEKYNVKIWEAITFKKTDFPLNWFKKFGFKEITEWAIMSCDVNKVLKKMQ